MSARVFVWPERTYEELGAERWAVSWKTVRPGANVNEEIDFDVDLVDRAVACRTHAAAVARARRAAAEDYFGGAVVQRQVVAWDVEEDRIAEWAPAGEPEYVEDR